MEARVTEPDDPSHKINAYIAALNAAIPELSALHVQDLSSDDVQAAIRKALDIDDAHSADVLDHSLTKDKIVGLLKDFDFNKGQPIVLHTLTLSEDDGIIPDDVPRMLTEKIVKVKGEVWEIHRYDADPFPSDPHAHNYDANLKLHLKTGALYDKKKRFQGNIGQKKLDVIRAELKNAGIKLP